MSGIKFIGAWQIRLVPENEIINILRQAATVGGVDEAAKGRFVRILGGMGPYKGDVGRVPDRKFEFSNNLSEKNFTRSIRLPISTHRRGLRGMLNALR